MPYVQVYATELSSAGPPSPPCRRISSPLHDMRAHRVRSRRLRGSPVSLLRVRLQRIHTGRCRVEACGASERHVVNCFRYRISEDDGSRGGLRRTGDAMARQLVGGPAPAAGREPGRLRAPGTVRHRLSVRGPDPLGRPRKETNIRLILTGDEARDGGSRAAACGTTRSSSPRTARSSAGEPYRRSAEIASASVTICPR